MSNLLRVKAILQRRWVWGCVGTLAVMALPAMADTVPASLRSCVSETDSTRRLSCFDREIARFPESKPDRVNGTVAAPAAAAAAAAVPQTASVKTAKAVEAKAPKRRTARVSSVEGPPDALVLRLDNGETWEQVREATAAMSFRAGDTVNIDQSQGSFWIGSRSGGVMMVRQRE
jgi:hypothetical protein